MFCYCFFFMDVESDFSCFMLVLFQVLIAENSASKEKAQV